MELELKFSVAPAVLFLETQLDDRIVGGLNKYLDARHKKGGESFAHKLVGQIAHGEQLKIDTEDALIKPFTQVVANMSQNYLQQFCKTVGVKPLQRMPNFHSLWSVHSYERDYNPVHDHGTDTVMGLSFSTWTKIPAQITDQPEYNSRDLIDSSGIANGFLQFHFGQTSSRGVEELRPPFSRMVKPVVGKIVMFPSWCQHCVYPFEGAGERRTVAGNLNMVPATLIE